MKITSGILGTLWNTVEDGKGNLVHVGDVRNTWGPDKMKMPPVSEANDSESGELEWDREHSRHTGKE